MNKKNIRLVVFLILNLSSFFVFSMDNKNILNQKLIRAVENGKLKEVKQLIKAGADVDSRNSEGKTPLIIAAWNNPEIVKLLINSKAYLDAQDDNGITALIIAVIGNVEAAKYLIHHGANINVRNGDRFNRTVLMISIVYQPEIFELLVISGADVNAKDICNRTPLMYAIFSKKSEMAKYLVAFGADVNAKDKFDESVRDYAIRYLPEILSYLLKKGMNLSETRKYKIQ